MNLEKPVKVTANLLEFNRRLLSSKLNILKKSSDLTFVYHAKHSQPALRAKHRGVS